MTNNRSRIAATAAARLARSREHISDLVEESEKLAIESLVFETRYEAASGISELHVVVPIPPPRIALMASEALHHLRSTLNMVAGAAVHSTAPDPEKIRRPQFPIRSDPVGYDTDVHTKDLRGGSKDLIQSIRALQPFSFAESLPGSIGILGTMNNSDKHTDLTPVASALMGPVRPKNIGMRVSESATMTAMEFPMKPEDSNPSETLIVSLKMDPTSARVTFTQVLPLIPYLDIKVYFEEAPTIPLRSFPMVIDDVERICDSVLEFV